MTEAGVAIILAGALGRGRMLCDPGETWVGDAVATKFYVLTCRRLQGSS